MKTKLFPVVLVTVALQLHALGGEPRENYVAHEWGTFTSVQGADGIQLEWNPLVTSELPGFVYDRNKSAALRGDTAALVAPVPPAPRAGPVTARPLSRLIAVAAAASALARSSAVLPAGVRFRSSYPACSPWTERSALMEPTASRTIPGAGRGFKPISRPSPH